MSHSQTLWDTDCAAPSFQCQGYQWQCCLSVVQLLKPLVRLLNSKSLSSWTELLCDSPSDNCEKPEKGDNSEASCRPSSRTPTSIENKLRVDFKEKVEKFYANVSRTKKKKFTFFYIFPHITHTWPPRESHVTHVAAMWLPHDLTWPPHVTPSSPFIWNSFCSF